VCDGFLTLIECPSVSFIFSHHGGSRALSVVKASWPTAG
jgi:hypothetical protein